MKIVSVMLIIAYLMLPAICFGHPCELFSAHSTHDASASDASIDNSQLLDTDDCETACCCAGHIPLSTIAEVTHAGLTDKLVPYEPHIALPQLIDRIFVPPQNHS